MNTAMATTMSALTEMSITAPLQRQSATIDCPRSMVGRVIGKGGDTIKALQKYTGALIQIDQSVEPTKVTISGTSESLMLAMSMVIDIVKGTFKGFALLRQLINPVIPAGGAPPLTGRPVYAPGYGLVPPVQVVNGPGSGQVTTNLLSSPSSSLDDQLLSSISSLHSPNNKLVPSVSLPAAVANVSTAFPPSSQYAALESPSSTLNLLRPAPASAYTASNSLLQSAAAYIPASAPIYSQLPTAPAMIDHTAMNSIRGLYPVKMTPTAQYTSNWPEAAQFGLTNGSAALSTLIGGAPTSPTIGVSWDPLSADAAYYTAQVTN